MQFPKIKRRIINSSPEGKKHKEIGSNISIPKDRDNKAIDYSKSYTLYFYHSPHVKIRLLEKNFKKNHFSFESDLYCRFLYLNSQYETKSKSSCKIYAYYK